MTKHLERFRTPLRFEDVGGLPFTLIDALQYDSDRLGAIVVPAGFQTDLASIPRSLWTILPPVGKYDAAAVVHDFLYQQPPAGCSRDDADAVLDEAMIVCGVPTWQRRLIYVGVRVGGWVVWRRYRAARAAVVVGADV